MKDENIKESYINNQINGVICIKELNENNINKNDIYNLVNEGKLIRYSRGIYIRNDILEDEFYLLQKKYQKGIYSCDKALYLLGYCDKALHKCIMTFPRGYHTDSIKEENIIIKSSINENYNLGIIEIDSPFWNKIRVYDLERTLCDILKGKNYDIQIVNYAMKKIHLFKKIIKYASMLRVKPKITKYLEILLWILKFNVNIVWRFWCN